MIFRKRKQRYRFSIRLILGALFINLLFPIHTATAAEPATDIPVGIESTRGPAAALPITPPAPAPTIIGPAAKLPKVAEKPPIVVKRLTVRASAYSSTRDQTDSTPFITASGARVRDGIVAANGLPFGTKVRIPSHYGEKVFVVEDRMHPRWGTKKIDIWMATRNQAKQWGVRTITLEVIK